MDLQTDQSSFSDPSSVQTKNLHLELEVDFSRKCLVGFVEIEFLSTCDALESVILDTNSLRILRVESETGAELEWKLLYERSSPVLGTPLWISLTFSQRRTTIRVFYETTSAGQALQWLTPEQTSTKKHPFLFSQCYAIHARSIVPCQDTPFAKSTYSAKISVPSPLVAVMSAIETGSAEENGLNIFEFKQNMIIPSYLLALAVGRLESREIGPRSNVWAEPDVVDRAAYEFANIEKFIAAAEEICGPYRWGRYDLLCLPPSFLYGGTENPNMTFVTPTLLAGDRSLEDVIIHEICHSWMGNWVTNKGWEHFWLNEGWTMFIQRKVMEKLYGSALSGFHAHCQLSHLRTTIEHFRTKGEMEFTKLVPTLGAGDPDDAFSLVPYEKGFNFLYYLETVAGGPKIFGEFIKAYIKQFGGSTLTSDDFKEFYKDFFRSNPSVSLESIDWDTWFYGEGGLPVRNLFNLSLRTEVNVLERRIRSGENYSMEDIKDWKPLQVTHLLDCLIQAKEGEMVNQMVLETIDRKLEFSKSRNAEIRFRWQMLGIKAEWEAIIPQVLAFIIEQGRMKYTRPLYRSLYRSIMGRKFALSTFLNYEQTYHPICQKMVRKDLEVHMWHC